MRRILQWLWYLRPSFFGLRRDDPGGPPYSGWRWKRLHRWYNGL